MTSPPGLVFAYDEEHRLLHVFDGARRATADFTPDEMMAKLVTFWNAQGAPLTPREVRTRWLWVFPRSSWELDPAPERKTLQTRLRSVEKLEPNPWFATLDAVRQSLTDQL